MGHPSAHQKNNFCPARAARRGGGRKPAQKPTSPMSSPKSRPPTEPAHRGPHTSPRQASWGPLYRRPGLARPAPEDSSAQSSRGKTPDRAHRLTGLVCISTRETRPDHLSGCTQPSAVRPSTSRRGAQPNQHPTKHPNQPSHRNGQDGRCRERGSVLLLPSRPVRWVVGWS